MDNANAWQERTTLTGDIDVTMIYAAHDAFTRDLQRIASAWQRGQAFTPGTLAGWAMLTKQPHIHHTAEDTSPWPKPRAAVSAPQEVAILDAMQMEHAQLDPLERVDAAIAAHDATSLDEGVHTLSAGLAAHMRHEWYRVSPRLASAHSTASCRSPRSTVSTSTCELLVPIRDRSGNRGS